MHLLALVIIGIKFCCKGLQHYPEPEENISVFWFAIAALKTDDVAHDSRAIRDVWTTCTHMAMAGQMIRSVASPIELVINIDSRSKMELLMFFECQCRGAKFYDLRSAGAMYGTHLKLVREPTNLQDPLNCVAAWVPGMRAALYCARAGACACN